MVTATAEIKEKVMDALHECYDPEIPVNIVDLGLVYNVDIDDDSNVEITMTLTAQGCPMSDMIDQQVTDAVEALDEVNDAHVDIVWEPRWNPQMISQEGRKQLGME
ncbi:MAG: metal-sulfur cluster assembly factor [Candidatus Marinimicrobia bacterium]|nr:metal-sulfur cluster assembly factor [Candidatus Neomarinimicrobiota bacterium]MCF7829921.1 metal-sulfur cluster assembly factor [Candidatus Neomarinimicrobiota bacterium]MCF7879116.1 metal-sulfur cluster assembly factor [Candidatus Neomarinimicrobiota bacterium]